MSRFSIVVPSNNSWRLLEQSLISLNDRQSPIECTVVDGTSEGESLHRYQESASLVGLNPRMIHRPGANMARAINLGMSFASGEFIGWLFAGETYSKGALEKVAAYFDAHAECDVVYGHADMIDGPNEIHTRFPLLHPTRRNLGRRECLASSAVFYRKRLFQHVGMLDESLTSWPMYDFWVQLHQRKICFGHIPEVLATVRGNSAERAFQADRKFLSPTNIDELMGIARRRLGQVSASRALYYSRWLAKSAGIDRETSGEYDRWVLKQSLKFMKGVDLETRSADVAIQPEHWTRNLLPLLAHHTVAEGKQILKRPKYLGRFAPKKQRFLLRNAFGRRLFRLKLDEPHQCRLARAYQKGRLPDVVPTISIVTPNLNQGPFIERTIRSVIEQGYPKLEYIVQDGLSTDESVEVIKRYAPQLSSWASVKDKGQSQAINLGLKRSHGEIMAYLNSDDVLLPGCLQYVANYFFKHPEIDVVYGDRLLIDEEDRVINYWVLPKHDAETLMWADYIPQETMFWRRSAWDRVGGCIDESFHFAMDWDLIMRFQAAGLKFAHLPRFLGAFRITDGQKTNQLLQTSGLREMNRIRERMLGFVPDEVQVTQQVRQYIRKQWYANAWHEIRQYLRKQTDGLCDWPPLSWKRIETNASQPSAETKVA